MPRYDKRLAFTYGHHSETNNYRPACARTSLAASRRPTLVVQEIYRVAVASTIAPTCIRRKPAVYRNRICGPLIVGARTSYPLLADQLVPFGT